MDFLTDFLSLSTVVFCLAIFALVWIQRRGVEVIYPKIKDQTSKLGKIWEGFIIHVLPLLTGGLLGGFISTYPYPDIFISASSRAFFGIVCGLVSGFAYRLLKQLIASKLDQKPEDVSGPYSE